MKTRSILTFLVWLLIFSPALYSQSKETGAIGGTVYNPQGNALRGVTITVSSPSLMGVRTVVSGGDGSYRFSALPPGQYTVKAEHQDFATVIWENIRLTTTARLTVDFGMKLKTAKEETTVISRPPTIDTASTETASITLPNEFLRNIPYSQLTPDIVNLAPGVNDGTAYGASSETGIAWMLDGANVSDPDSGAVWVYLDHNIIGEAKVMGVGLPAEYGNFTGVVFNLITKSGGNEYHGQVEFDFQGKPKGFWRTTNQAAYFDDFPGLTSPMTQSVDINAQIGGPLKTDKLWFYSGLQWNEDWDYPTDFPEPINYVQPRFFGKLTAQFSPNTSMNVSLEADAINGTNRGAGAAISPMATLDQKAPEVIGNFSLTHMFSSESFFNLQLAYFWGYLHLEPKAGNVSGHFDYGTNELTESAGYFSNNDRSRLQANASFSHYAEDFIAGDHDFKFGVEIEHASVRNQFGYTGPANIYYFDYYNEPYLAYQYVGYDLNSSFTRVDAFAQDSWQITPRFNINAGLRLSQNWGKVQGVDGAVFNTFRLDPRIGFTVDLLGDKSTVLKAHYGQYAEGMYTTLFDRLNPPAAFSDYIGYYWDSELQEYIEFTRTTPQGLYQLAYDIKLPYMTQFMIGIERELFKDASLGITYINREWNDIIGLYDLRADYEPYSVDVPDLEKTYEVYQRTFATVDTHEYIIANLKKEQPYILDNPYRKYWAIEFLFNKRFSNKWQLILSYVYSQASGTMDNQFANDIGWNGRDDLNTSDPNFWINADGHPTYDPTSQIKIQGTYVLPFGISLSAYYHGISGNTWTTRYRTERLNQGTVTFFTEPRGSNHYQMANLLDLRLEKVFTLANKYHLGLLVDVFNVFNDNTITSWGTLIGYDWIPGAYPSTDGHELYSLVNPRQARVGIRLIF